MKTIKDIISKYTECFYFDVTRAQMATSGDAEELASIGTDFAKCKMFIEAVECREYIANSCQTIDPSVYCNLGASYFYGNGVELNYEKAVHYHQKSAAKGHPFGQYNYAVALEQSKGIKQCVIKAIEFYHKAASNHVIQAIDALCRLGEYNEIHGFASYGRNLNDDSFLGNQ